MTDGTGPSARRGGRTTRARRRLAGALAWAALSLALPGRASDPALTAELRDLKVAYLFNFAQFAEWPREAWTPGAAPFVVCATSREGVGASLMALQGRRLRGSEVLVSHPRNAQEARRCQLLYADDEALPWVRQLGDAPVLVVGNAPGGAGFPLSFEVRGERLRWTANLAAARQAGIRLNSKLVELAVQVIDPPGERP